MPDCAGLVLLCIVQHFSKNSETQILTGWDENWSAVSTAFYEIPNFQYCAVQHFSKNPKTTISRDENYSEVCRNLNRGEIRWENGCAVLCSTRFTMFRRQFVEKSKNRKSMGQKQFGTVENLNGEEIVG